MFSALDYLNRWTRARAHSLAVKTQLLSSRNRSGLSVTGESFNFIHYRLGSIGSVMHSFYRFDTKLFVVFRQPRGVDVVDVNPWTP